MNLTYRFCNYLWTRSWFRPEFGKTVYKTICRYGDAPDVPFEKNFFGHRYRGNLQNTIDFSVFYYGAFEKPLLFFMRDFLSRLSETPKVFCDIGANIGQHSLFMSSYADQVHAFEPFKPVRDRLLKQIELNNINNIEVHDHGLSDLKQSLPFFAPTGRNQGIGSFNPGTMNKGNIEIGELDLVVGDEYLAEKNIDSIGLIKIDVEGFEKAVLRGLASTLGRLRPVVVFEITYEEELSLSGMNELASIFPEKYAFLTFDTRKPNGRKARRKGGKNRHTGSYRLIPFSFNHPIGQDDVVACPVELVNSLPMKNLEENGEKSHQ